MAVDPTPALVEDLLRPESYPPPRPAAIELRTTHISWVFLTEQHAYKVKRPVDFGFVDYTTVERRRHFCEEELRLNRRLAPDVYEAVLPIRGGPGGASFTGPGPIVDHAVRMRRLPDDRTAAALLAAGELRSEHLVHLAQRLAAFYAEVPATPAFGSLATICDNVEENLAGLAPFAGSLLDPEVFASVANAQRTAIRRHAFQIEGRARTGHVRDGHGDLRLEHVYFGAGTTGDRLHPLVIDAVEFNPRFRCADVALDVAFLAMELEAAGRADLASYFTYRFARASNDYEFYPLLDFYLAYRALVRAKIACLVARDPSTPAAKAERKRQEAVRLVELARTHDAGRRRRPLVVAVGGLVGAGKSTLAEALARTIGTTVVSSDATRKYLGGLAPLDRGAPTLYTDALRSATYAELIRRAGLVLGSGRSVILDGTFRDERTRKQARDLAASHDAQFLFIEATCAEATLRARLAARATRASESDADEGVLAKIRAEFRPPLELLASERVAVDTSRDEQALTRDLLPRLGR